MANNNPLWYLVAPGNKVLTVEQSRWRALDWAKDNIKDPHTRHRVRGGLYELKFTGQSTLLRLMNAPEAKRAGVPI